MTHPSPLAGEGTRSRSERGGEGLSLPTREELLVRAKWMRANPTEAEKRLWSILRAKRLVGYKFKRQLIIYPYITDFVCLSERLIVEADGSQHADDQGDLRRDAFLRGQGFRILRFWNNQVLGEPDSVAAAIFAALSGPHPASVPHPPRPAAWAPPSPEMGEGNGATNA